MPGTFRLNYRLELRNVAVALVTRLFYLTFTLNSTRVIRLPNAGAEEEALSKLFIRVTFTFSTV